MQKSYYSYLYVLVFLMLTTSCAQNTVDSKYFFVNNEKLFSLEQRNDTIFEYRYYKNFDFRKKPRKQYKVIKTKRKENLTLIVVERVDSIPLSSKPLRDDRYFIIGIEKLSKHKIKVVNEIKSYTKDSISKLNFEFDLIQDKFGYTYYEESYLKSLNSDFEIDRFFANQVIESMKNSYPEVLRQYQSTKTGDLYGTGIMSELLGREMVKRNLSPISSRTKLKKSMK